MLESIPGMRDSDFETLFAERSLPNLRRVSIFGNYVRSRALNLYNVAEFLFRRTSHDPKNDFSTVRAIGMDFDLVLTEMKHSEVSVGDVAQAASAKLSAEQQPGLLLGKCTPYIWNPVRRHKQSIDFSTPLQKFASRTKAVLFVPFVQVVDVAFELISWNAHTHSWNAPILVFFPFEQKSGFDKLIEEKCGIRADRQRLVLFTFSGGELLTIPSASIVEGSSVYVDERVEGDPTPPRAFAAITHRLSEEGKVSIQLLLRISVAFTELFLSG